MDNIQQINRLVAASRWIHTNWSLASRLASVLVLLKLDGIVRGMIDGIYVLDSLA